VLPRRIIGAVSGYVPYRIDIVSQEVGRGLSAAYLRGLAKIARLYAFAPFVLFSILGVRYRSSWGSLRAFSTGALIGQW